MQAIAGENNKSPLDYWRQQELNQKWLRQMLLDPDDIDAYHLREGLYRSGVKEVSPQLPRTGQVRLSGGMQGALGVAQKAQ